MMQAIDDLLRYFTDNDLADTLNPPASEEEIAQLESAFGYPLPEAFKAMYRRFNGQRRSDGQESEDRFLAIAEMLTMHRHWQEYLRDNFGDDWQTLTPGESDNDGVIANVLFHRAWLPFLTHGGDLTCLDFAPGQQGQAGQVIAALIDDNIEDYVIDVENEDFQTWLEDYPMLMSEDFHSNMEKLMDTFVNEFGEGQDELFAEARQYRDAIEAHYEQWFGEIESVYHEIVSDLVHIDIHMIPPTEERPWITLATTGMSDLPMQVPEFEGSDTYTRAELLIYLPPDWPLDQQSFENESNYWPLRWLKILARLPHEYETWLGEGHTIPNNDPPERIADTPFSGFLLLPPLLSQPEEAYALVTEDGETIRFYCLIPLYREEMDYKIAHGLSELIDHFDTDHITEVVDVHRQNLAPAE